MEFTELHLQNHRPPRSPSSQALQFSGQISQCYVTAVLQPRAVHLGTRGSDFATAGLKEIQMISSVTHSTGQNPAACIFPGGQCPELDAVRRKNDHRMILVRDFGGLLLAVGGKKKVSAHHKFLFLKLSHVKFCHIRVKSSSLVLCSELLLTD